MNSDIIKIIITGIIFILVDSIYLTSTKTHFNNLITQIQGSTLILDNISLILTYIALIAGLYYFIIKDKRPVKDAILLGLAVYSVYEFTNKAILKDWTWNTVLMDTLWGGILYGVSTYLVYKMYGIK
jgi:uncharacterized membrane protein